MKDWWSKFWRMGVVFDIVLIALLVASFQLKLIDNIRSWEILFYMIFTAFVFGGIVGLLKK